MKDNLSPEEKLLKLIKGEKKQKIAIDKNLSANIVDLKPVIKNPAHTAPHRYLTAISIQKLIPVLFVASVIYLLVSFVYPWVGSKELKLPDVSVQKLEEANLKPKAEQKPYEFYLEGIRQHQIFASPAATTSIPETPPPQLATAPDLMKDISLVGIVSGENLQAVIEDKKAQKTYYVTKGQSIGEIQVEDILEGKIIVNYKGNRFELYL